MTVWVVVTESHDRDVGIWVDSVWDNKEAAEERATEVEKIHKRPSFQGKPCDAWAEPFEMNEL